MKNRILVVVSSLFLVVSCLEEASFDTPNPALGQEVGFAARVSNPETKTLYGTPEIEIDEETGKVTGTSIKVKWVHDDKITVYGTNCADGRKQAEYAVKTYVKTTQDGTTTTTEDILGATPNTGDGQNYADELVKTGAFGVQWGTEQTSDFYAVYPSVSDGAFKITEENSVTVQTSIGTTQYLSFTSTATTLQGIPFDETGKKYGMSNALMYACTSGAKATSESVDLAFIPFSTVLKITVPTWSAVTNSDLAQNVSGKSLIVKSITVTAPQNVFGDFQLQLNKDGSAEAGAGSSNVAQLIPSENLKWTYGQALEFSVFAIPLEDVSMANWIVSIELTSTNDQNQTVDFNKTFTFTGNDKTLQSGSIHNVRLTNGFAVDAAWSYSPETWLETIPRNVYISDLSLPGSWYSADPDYQSGTIQQQYSAGIRAFNIDCRLTVNSNIYVGNANGKTGTPNILDYLDDAWCVYKDNMNHVGDANETLVLTCAGTEEGELGKVSEIGTTVKSALIQIGQLAQNNSEEYVEVILTVAQKPFQENTLKDYIRGTVNAQMVLKAITLLLNDSEVKPYIYGSGQNEKITPKTTIRDVCGKVVVKVNSNTSKANIKSWGYTAPMLISEGSMSESAGASNFVVSGNFSQMNQTSMYWSNDYIDGYDENMLPNHKDGAMYYYYHQAQNTTGANGHPNVSQRKKAIVDVLSQSYNIYHNNTHDGMFQIGIGGWTSDNSNGKATLSSELKPFVYNIINSMITQTPFDPQDGGGMRVFTPAPVGAVLMNHANDGDKHSTKALIDAIIELNGKYFLNRDKTQPEWPE